MAHAMLIKLLWLGAFAVETDRWGRVKYFFRQATPENQVQSKFSNDVIYVHTFNFL